jgi:RNA polymerase sigma factor (sigma-70 family)
MSDREQTENKLLVMRCQEGDSRAMSELIFRWKDRLWRHALRLSGGDEDAAWDILQDGFLAISVGVSKLNDAAAFPAWAYRIITNKARLWQRGECRRRKVQKEYREEQLRDTRSSPPADTADRVSSIHAAIKQLSAKDQAILGMRYEEGFSIIQIANILNIAQGTVKSRLFNARERLKKTLEEIDHG